MNKPLLAVDVGPLVDVLHSIQGTQLEILSRLCKLEEIQDGLEARRQTLDARQLAQDVQQRSLNTRQQAQDKRQQGQDECQQGLNAQARATLQVQAAFPGPGVSNEVTSGAESRLSRSRAAPSPQTRKHGMFGKPSRQFEDEKRPDSEQQIRDNVLKDVARAGAEIRRTQALLDAWPMCSCPKKNHGIAESGASDQQQTPVHVSSDAQTSAEEPPSKRARTHLTTLSATTEVEALVRPENAIMIPASIPENQMNDESDDDFLDAIPSKAPGATPKRSATTQAPTQEPSELTTPPVSSTSRASILSPDVADFQIRNHASQMDDSDVFGRRYVLQSSHVRRTERAFDPGLSALVATSRRSTRERKPPTVDSDMITWKDVKDQKLM